jgi:hypothetical protein
MLTSRQVLPYMLPRPAGEARKHIGARQHRDAQGDAASSTHIEQEKGAHNGALLAEDPFDW